MSSRELPSASRQLLILVIVAGVAFGALLFFSRETLEDTWRTLTGAKLEYVLLLPLIQSLNYFLIGQYYRGMFAAFDTRFTRARAWGVVAAMNFVNQVLPSGGLSGITYLAYGFRSKLETGKTTLIQLGRYIFAFVSYAVIGPVALLLIIQSGDIKELGDVVEDSFTSTGSLITGALFVLFSWFLVALIFNRRLARWFGRKWLGGVNWFNRHLLRRKRPLQMNFLRRMYREFTEGVDFIREAGIGTLKPAGFMLLSALAELSIVYVSLAAVTDPPSIGVVFTSFVAANIVGVVSIIPGDVGVHEATVILVLVAFGVPEGAAIAATLLYRVFNKFIFLPVGFYFYTRILKPALNDGRTG